MKVPDYLSGVRPTQVSWRGRAISVQHINRNIRREERRLEWLRSRDEYVRTEPGQRPGPEARAARFAAQRELMERLSAEQEVWDKMGISFEEDKR